jgi:hypothetical protein
MHYKLISFVEQNRDKIHWSWLSKNPSTGAISLLEQNQDRIDWDWLSRNPEGISLLEQNQDKIHWRFFSANPRGIALLEKNQDKICWELISTNPAIFTYDYDAMKKHMYESEIAEQLMQNRFHPRNLSKMEGWGFDSILSEL